MSECPIAQINEDDEDTQERRIEVQGYLNKWTNFLHGWQKRYFVLKNGTLLYFKSASETEYGCRGAISLFKATVKLHEVDDCRFDISLNDCVWYLRADSPATKNHWIDVIDSFKAESGYGSENNLKRNGSSLSILSCNMSTMSPVLKKNKGLQDKLSELTAFRNILINQLDRLQIYFDTCLAEFASSNEELSKHEAYQKYSCEALDFKGEAVAFKATSSGIIEILRHCIEVMNQREEMWESMLEKEINNRKDLEEVVRTLSLVDGLTDQERVQVLSGADLTEHSTITDDEFYDAVESSNENSTEDSKQIKGQLLQRSKNNNTPSKDINWASYIRAAATEASLKHPYWPDIEHVVAEQIRAARMGLGKGAWQLFVEDGEMRMYRREVEEDGMVVDPLKATHQVKGITGRELLHYFFYPEYRYDWEGTLETMNVVNEIANDTIVFHQIHKRIWPAAQRDCTFWSHLTHVPDVDNESEDGPHIWAVVNNSVELPSHVANEGKLVRLFVTIILMGQTVIAPETKDKELKRDDITCKITYCAVVNPGGWAPSTVLRAVYKREYPKFLKRFTAYVIDKTKNLPIKL
ncbi:ceramide transfer protein [Daktulosphaira vitifoliae]|uniref:ceramide transfer protein n=1 Tax=Daktulosphaira vitifoliae TaxID=58002 RepID=UPI0021AAD777|nr:ceramide transfer protein [Daktulosphaira vitifoliae]